MVNLSSFYAILVLYCLLQHLPLFWFYIGIFVFWFYGDTYFEVEETRHSNLHAGEFPISGLF